MKTALVAGASGLVGSQLVTTLLEDQRYETVKAVSRKPLKRIHARLENVVVDFNSLARNPEILRADDIFCCLGTTMKTAGSKAAFEKVDFNYPLELAKIGKSLGVQQYLLVSALGANPNSSIYYNRVKGKVEAAISEVGYDTVHLFRPSLLVGPREAYRSGEAAAKWFFRTFGFLVPTRYKAIASIKVARAMAYYARSGEKGIHIHESVALQKF
jgi:uncharacterized protein YbjT (DUF2867 family)